MNTIQKLAWFYLSIAGLTIIAYSVLGLTESFRNAHSAFDIYNFIMSLAYFVSLIYLYAKTSRGKSAADQEKAAACARERANSLRAMRIAAVAALAITYLGTGTYACVLEKRGQTEITVSVQAVDDAAILGIILSTALWAIIFLTISARPKESARV